MRIYYLTNLKKISKSEKQKFASYLINKYKCKNQINIKVHKLERSSLLIDRDEFNNFIDDENLKNEIETFFKCKVTDYFSQDEVNNYYIDELSNYYNAHIEGVQFDRDFTLEIYLMIFNLMIEPKGLPIKYLNDFKRIVNLKIKNSSYNFEDFMILVSNIYMCTMEITNEMEV